MYRDELFWYSITTSGLLCPTCGFLCPHTMSQIMYRDELFWYSITTRRSRSCTSRSPSPSRSMRSNSCSAVGSVTSERSARTFGARALRIFRSNELYEGSALEASQAARNSARVMTCVCGLLYGPRSAGGPEEETGGRLENPKRSIVEPHHVGFDLAIT